MWSNLWEQTEHVHRFSMSAQCTLADLGMCLVREMTLMRPHFLGASTANQRR